MFRGRRAARASATFSESSCQIYFPIIGTSSKGNLKDTNNVKHRPSPPCPPLNSTDNKPCGLCCATSFPNIS